MVGFAPWIRKSSLSTALNGTQCRRSPHVRTLGSAVAVGRGRLGRRTPTVVDDRSTGRRRRRPRQRADHETSPIGRSPLPRGGSRGAPDTRRGRQRPSRSARAASPVRDGAASRHMLRWMQSATSCAVIARAAVTCSSGQPATTNPRMCGSRWDRPCGSGAGETGTTARRRPTPSPRQASTLTRNPQRRSAGPPECPAARADG
jgi:hypothetical protein